MSGSKETLLLEPEKSAPRIETLEPEKVDEEEEGKKDESSCSSEEEEDEDSESETEAGARAALASQRGNKCVWVFFLGGAVIFNFKRGLACRQEQALGVGEQQRDGHLHQHHRVSAHQPHKPGDDPHFSAQEGTAGWEGGVSSRARASGWLEREKSRKSRKTSSPSPSRLFSRGQFLASLWLGINRTFRTAHK